MSLKKTYNKQRNICLALTLTAGLLLLSGCRQPPKDSPEFYESELAAMRREAMQAQRVEKPLKDGYPWRGKIKEPCLPYRIKTMEKNIKVEIDYLHETVHGKKKSRLRLRD